MMKNKVSRRCCRSPLPWCCTDHRLERSEKLGQSPSQSAGVRIGTYFIPIVPVALAPPRSRAVDLLLGACPVGDCGTYVVAGALATITWLLIEKPIRDRRGWFTTRRVFIWAAGVSCIVIAAGATLRSAERLWQPPPTLRACLPQQMTTLLAKADAKIGIVWPRHSLRIARLVTTAEASLILPCRGDSHAGAIGEAVAAAAKEVTKRGLQFTSDNCPPLLDTNIVVDKTVTDCGARNAAAFELRKIIRFAASSLRALGFSMWMARRCGLGDVRPKRGSRNFSSARA